MIHDASFPGCERVNHIVIHILSEKQHESSQNSQETNGTPFSSLFETLVKATDLRDVSRPPRPSQKASKVRPGRPGGM